MIYIHVKSDISSLFHGLLFLFSFFSLFSCETRNTTLFFSLSLFLITKHETMKHEKHTDAITCYRKALSLRPDFPDAFTSLMFSLLHICDWRGRSSHLQKIEELLDRQLHAPGTTPSMQPFQAFMCQNISAEKEIHLARCYSERAKRNTTLLQMPPFRFRARLPSEPLHIGYVSSNFGNHTLGHMMQSKCFC